MCRGWRHRKSGKRVSVAFLRRRHHLHRHHCRADNTTGGRVRPGPDSQGMSAAADIIRASTPRTSWNWGAALIALCFVLACAAPLAVNGYGLYLLTLTEIFEWRSLTGGGGGLALTAPSIAGYELGATALYYLTLVLMTLGLFGAWNVSRGRTGRALLVIKDSEIAAGSLGIYAPRYKVIAFAISAFYAAIAGGLFAYLVRYINPQSFSVRLSISFLSIVVILRPRR